MKKFVIEIEPWDRKLLVVVGGYTQEIFNAISLFNFSEAIRQVIEEQPPDESDEASQWGSDITCEYIIWLEKWENSEEDCELLIHETNHLLYDLAKWIPLTTEWEGQAYTQVSVYRKIKKVLNTP